MKIRKLRYLNVLAIYLLIEFLTADIAHAAGFVIYDQSAEGLGKCSAVVASTKGAEAIWYNPAGLTLLSGYEFQASGIVFINNADFTEKNTGAETKAKTGLYPMPAFFAAGRLSEKIQAGIGIFSAFGLGLSWPEEWLGREDTIKGELVTLTVNPTIAIQLNRQLSLGIGFDVTRAAVDITNGLPSPMDGTLRIGGTSWGYGGNIGLLYRAIPDKFHLGLTYRSRMKLSFSGQADFDLQHPEFSSIPDLQDQVGKSELTFPDIITAGGWYKITPHLSWNLDLTYTLWSTYDREILTFENAPEAIIEHQYRNVFTIRTGVDWAALTPGFHLRMGFLFEQNPAHSEYLTPSLPDGHLLNVSVGAGYEKGPFKGDLGYLFAYLIPPDATTGIQSPEGTYHSTTHVIAATLTYHYDSLEVASR